MEGFYATGVYEPATLENELRSPTRLSFFSLDATGAPMGYLTLNTESREDCVSGVKPIELQRLYVRRVAHGTGIAAALMRHALSTAAAHGFETIWLGVWERNPRAQAFYRKYGFEQVGGHTFMMGEEAQLDLIFTRPVRLRDDF